MIGRTARRAGAGTVTAGPDSPRDFLRRILFEIPPARHEKSGEVEGITVRLKPLPARKAKLSLVEVLRDLALEDPKFAKAILPLLEEFMISRGQSEMAACLVAVTGIRHTHPELKNSEKQR